MPIPQNESVFGSTLAVTSDGILLVVRQLANVSPNGAGAVYAFNPRTGQLLDTLLDPNAINSGRFGASVATLPDNAILVGASQGDVGPGVAYQFSQVPEPAGFELLASAASILTSFYFLAKRSAGKVNGPCQKPLRENSRRAC